MEQNKNAPNYVEIQLQTEIELLNVGQEQIERVGNKTAVKEEHQFKNYLMG